MAGSRSPRIRFYIPREDWPYHVPTNIDAQWKIFARGIYCWTLQTYLRLRSDGILCELVSVLPEDGIVLAHRAHLPFHLSPSPKLTIVCLRADYEPHPFAQLHIVQNPLQESPRDGSYFIPLWPQPGLIPRDKRRAHRFETIAYFGIAANLAPELRSESWRANVDAIGLRWEIVTNPHSWNDYGGVDAILAVRGFSGQPYPFKPASKLFAAWHAGVPAVLGRESAYRAARRGSLDYLEVESEAHALKALERLKRDEALRREMIANGRRRAAETDVSCLSILWREFLTRAAPDAHSRWLGSTVVERRRFLTERAAHASKSALHPRYPLDFRSTE